MVVIVTTADRETEAQKGVSTWLSSQTSETARLSSQAFLSFSVLDPQPRPMGGASSLQSRVSGLGAPTLASFQTCGRCSPGYE